MGLPPLAPAGSVRGGLSVCTLKVAPAFLRISLCCECRGDNGGLIQQMQCEVYAAPPKPKGPEGVVGPILVPSTPPSQCELLG